MNWFVLKAGAGIGKIIEKAGGGKIARFFCFIAKKAGFYAVLLILAGLLCAADFWLNGQTRKTFRFYAADNVEMVVEERFLPRAKNAGQALEGYVREYLLGPFSVNTAAVFNPGTVLESLIVKGKEAYISLSEQALIPNTASGSENSVLSSFLVFKEEVVRNFPSIKTVRIFAGGNEVTL